MFTVKEFIDIYRYDERTVIVYNLEDDEEYIYDDMEQLGDDFGEYGICAIEEDECITVTVTRNSYTAIYAQAYESYSIQKQIKDVLPIVMSAVNTEDISADEALMIIEDLVCE